MANASLHWAFPAKDQTAPSCALANRPSSLIQLTLILNAVSCNMLKLVNEIEINLICLLKIEKSKANGDNCTGLYNECDSTVGISCIMVNKIKQCS